MYGDQRLKKTCFLTQIKGTCKAASNERALTTAHRR
ncbi:hypothetical protein V6Z12_A11G342400 [Gossypium hirsutum]